MGTMDQDKVKVTRAEYLDGKFAGAIEPVTAEVAVGEVEGSSGNICHLLGLSAA